MSCQFFALLRDKTDGKFLWDKNKYRNQGDGFVEDNTNGSWRPLSDESAPLTFAVGEENVCPVELLGRDSFREAKYPREYTTSETIDGINSDGAWGSVTFNGKVYFREDVEIEFSRRGRRESSALTVLLIGSMKEVAHRNLCGQGYRQVNQ